jgi:4-hydroxy-2-oxoheptanedioate aldolase
MTDTPTTLLEAFLILLSTPTAEIMGGSGFDVLTVDMQHGAMGYETAFATLQALSGCPVRARVPGPDATLVGRMLDAGAEGVICPMVETPEEVAAFVAACRHPPENCRSFGPTRPFLTEGSAYHRTANARVLPVVMIETAAALEAIEDICAVPGLSGVYVGPTDLGIALGLETGGDREDAAFPEAVDRVRAAARAAGVMACMHAGSAAYARRMAARGFDLVTVAADYDLLLHGARGRVAEMRGRA